MSKVYQVEVKFTKERWTLVESHTRQVDALQYVREHAGESYPMRVVRVERTIVFDGSKT